MDFGEAFEGTAQEEGGPTGAIACLVRQHGHGGGYAYSLDQMWRTVGCPVGYGPRQWAGLAAPLIGGVARYMAALEDFHGGMPGGCRSLGVPGEVLFELTN